MRTKKAAPKKARIKPICWRSGVGGRDAIATLRGMGFELRAIELTAEKLEERIKASSRTKKVYKEEMPSWGRLIVGDTL